MLFFKYLKPRLTMSGLFAPGRGRIFPKGKSPVDDAYKVEKMFSALLAADIAFISDVICGCNSGRVQRLESAFHEWKRKINDRQLVEKFCASKILLLRSEISKETSPGPVTKYSIEAISSIENRSANELLKSVEDEISELTKELAEKYADIRIFIHAGALFGNEYQSHLQSLMSEDESARSKALRSYLDKREMEKELRMIQNQHSNKNFIPIGGFEIIKPQPFEYLRAEYQRLRKPIGVRARRSEVLEFALSNFTLPWLPMASIAVPKYAEETAWHLISQQWLERWGPAIQSNFSGTAPHLAKYLNEFREKYIERS